MHSDAKGIGSSDNDRNFDLKRRNLHAYTREDLAKTKVQKSQEMKVSSMRRKT